MDFLAKAFRLLVWGTALLIYGIGFIILLPFEALSMLAEDEEYRY